MSVEQLAQRIRDILGPYNDDHESLQNLISNLVLMLDEHEESLQGKVLVPSELLQHKAIGIYSDDRSIDYNDGWNDCIDEITESQEPKQ